MLVRVVRWVAFGASFPVGGLLAHLAVGPIREAGGAFAAGLIAGLPIGVAGAWAMRRSMASWTLATALSLGTGNAVGTFAAAVFPVDVLHAMFVAGISGVFVGAAQTLVGPPTRRLHWLPLVTTAWIGGWATSLVFALSPSDGYVVFGWTGATLFVIVMLVAVKSMPVKRSAEADEEFAAG